MTDLFEKRVEAAAEAIYDEVVTQTDLSMTNCESIARIALAEADAVVTEEMIEQVVLLSESKQEAAQSVAALFRGGGRG